MKKRGWVMVASSVIALVIGVYVVLGAASGRARAVPASAAPSARPVRVQEVRAATGTGEQAFTGVVHARHESDLAFRVGGKMIRRLVEVGDRVHAGQVLARLDPRDSVLVVHEAEADLAAAEASLRRASLDDDRTTRLVDERAIPVSGLDRTRSERDGARARQERARIGVRLATNRLADCTLTADADGVVTALPVEVGQVVAAGQVIARVARSGELEAVVSLPENQVEAVREGRASVTFWSRQDARREAVLREVSPSADPATRTYAARFTIQEPGPQIALGMTVTVQLMSTATSPGYALPLSALLGQGTEPALWVVDRASGHLTRTPVEVVRYGQESVVVTGGVKSGDLVVTAGVQKLDEGLLVRPWEPSR